MSEAIKVGSVVKAKHIRSPAMLVIGLHVQNDDNDLAQLLWFDANMNARQLSIEASLLEHVPEHP